MGESLKAGGSLYDSVLPQGTFDGFYEIVRQFYPVLPTTIDHYSSSHTICTSPDLALAQTCGSNLTQEYHQYLSVLGTPIYAVEG